MVCKLYINTKVNKMRWHQPLSLEDRADKSTQTENTVRSKAWEPQRGRWAKPSGLVRQVPEIRGGEAWGSPEFTLPRPRPAEAATSGPHSGNWWWLQWLIQWNPHQTSGHYIIRQGEWGLPWQSQCQVFTKTQEGGCIVSCSQLQHLSFKPWSHADLGLWVIPLS